MLYIYLKKNFETDAGSIDFHWFYEFFKCLILDLSFFTNADVVTIKDCEIRETNAGPINFHRCYELF